MNNEEDEIRLGARELPKQVTTHVDAWAIRIEITTCARAWAMGVWLSTCARAWAVGVWLSTCASAWGSTKRKHWLRAECRGSYMLMPVYWSECVMIRHWLRPPCNYRHGILVLGLPQQRLIVDLTSTTEIHFLRVWRLWACPWSVGEVLGLSSPSISPQDLCASKFLLFVLAMTGTGTTLMTT